MARNSGIDMLKKVAKTIEDHFEDMLAYFQTSRIEKARQPCSPLIPIIRDKIGHLSRLFNKKNN